MKIKIKSALLNNSLFHDLSDIEMDKLIKQEGVTTISFQKNEIIFPITQKKCLYLLIEGTAESFQGQTLLTKFGPSDIFGAASLFCNKRYPTIIKAKSQGIVVCISKDVIIDLMSANINFAQKYVSFLSDKIYFLNQKIDAFTSDNTDNKVIKYLYSCAENNTEFDLTVSISKLANILHIGRASIYRTFYKLEEMGIIKRSQKHIQILNKDKLKQFCKGREKCNSSKN